MPNQYVMTLTAANRVGILAAVSNAVAELGGDVQEVSVTVMRSFFTIILCADFPEHREAQVIVDHLRDIGRPYDLEVCLKDAGDASLAEQFLDFGETHFLRVTGQNQPGMMRLVASRLAQDGVDIADMYAVRNSDDSFDMMLEISVPAGIDSTELVAALEELGGEAGVSARLESPGAFVASRVPHSLRTTALHIDRDAI